jgi:RNA polymerase sigma factor for flagellar operon FliA
MTVDEFQESLLAIANSSVLALDDLWTFADPEGGGGQISVLDTLHDPGAMTLREIGEVLGVTESRVSQLHTKAVLALRSRFATRSDEI